MKISISCHIQ
jgi:hypothetical protein